MKKKILAIVITSTMMLSACSTTEPTEETSGSDICAAETEATEAVTTSETTVETTVETAVETTVETSEETVEETVEEITPVDLSDVEVGDYVCFGNYDQVGDYTMGVAPIPWIVLDVEDDRIFVVSKYIVDYQAYNEEMVDITWEECTLRAWLNDDFLNAAFSESEQEQILTVTVSNPDNLDYGSGTEGGNDTEDKIFLLSADEVVTYFEDDDARAVGACDWWWLRSPGFKPNHASIVLTEGIITTHGHLVCLNYYDHGVRPAMWISTETAS